MHNVKQHLAAGRKTYAQKRATQIKKPRPRPTTATTTTTTTATTTTKRHQTTTATLTTELLPTTATTTTMIQLHDTKQPDIISSFATTSQFTTSPFVNRHHDDNNYNKHINTMSLNNMSFHGTKATFQSSKSDSNSTQHPEKYVHFKQSVHVHIFYLQSYSMI